MQLSRTLALICLVSLPASAQTLVRSVNGPAVNAQYGKACIRIPDQNGDGYKDLLVGAPGFNSQRGAVFCLSGAYLASGTGVQTLWSAAPAAGSVGDAFGTSLALLGNVVGSSAPDFAVGAPGLNAQRGAIYVVEGTAHTVFAPLIGSTGGGSFGIAIATVSDRNGDGRSELAVGAPGLDVVFLMSGALLSVGGSLSGANTLASIIGGSGMGSSLASGFDLDGDGFDELVMGAPLADVSGANDAGALTVFSTAPTNPWSAGYSAAIASERLGSSVDAAHDYDGDGVIDILVGAPNSPDGSGSQLGRVVVLSGAKLFAQTPPYEIRTLTTSPGNLIGGSHFHFGASVRASADLNGDGVGEILVGAPDYFSVTPFPTNYGFAALYSGASGSRLATIYGAATNHFGDALAGAFGDLDGDGFEEFVVAGSLSDAGGTDIGVVKCYRLFPVAPSIYCTGKINSLGCTPAVAFSGSPSETSSAPFLISASNFLNQKNGLFFYSHIPTAVAFQGGTKCVHAPFVRGPMLSSGGASSGSSCTGAYSFDFNAWMQAGNDFSLVAGAEVHVQYWARDPASASHTSLSNAVRFLINP